MKKIISVGNYFNKKLSEEKKEAPWWEAGGFSSEEEYEKALKKEITPIESYAIKQSLMSQGFSEDNLPDIVGLTIDGSDAGYWVLRNNKYIKSKKEVGIELPSSVLSGTFGSKASLKTLSRKFAQEYDVDVELDEEEPETEKTERITMPSVYMHPPEHVPGTILETKPSLKEPSVFTEMPVGEIIRSLDEKVMDSFLTEKLGDSPYEIVNLTISGIPAGTYEKKQVPTGHGAWSGLTVMFEKLPETVYSANYSLTDLLEWLQSEAFTSKRAKNTLEVINKLMSEY